MALLQLSPLLAMLNGSKNGESTKMGTEESGALFKDLLELLQTGMPESEKEERMPFSKILRHASPITETEELPVDFIPKNEKGSMPERKIAKDFDRTVLSLKNRMDEKGTLPLRQKITQKLQGIEKREIPHPDRDISDAVAKNKKVETKFEAIEPILTKKEKIPEYLFVSRTMKEERLEAVKKGTKLPESPVSEPLSRLFTLLHGTAEDRNPEKRVPTLAKPSFDPTPTTPEKMMVRHETVHAIRNAKNIDDLTKTAEKAGLRPTKIVLEREEKSKKIEKEKPSSKIPERYPKQAAHISKSAASLLRETTLRPLRGKTGSRDSSYISEESAPKEPKNEASVSSAQRSPGTETPLKDMISLVAGLRKDTASIHEVGPLETKIVEMTRQAESEAKEGKNLSSESLPKEGMDGEVPDILHTESTGAKELLHQKIVDAKATIRHFAQALQEQVENYKPPFTRMKMTLEPKELGTVELTLVNRGNNLHIQVHSNPNAIGIMATQGQELKNQLVSMGFTDVQMQFNMNQQRQQQQRQQGRSGASYGSTEEIPEFYESLDITLPQYV